VFSPDGRRLASSGFDGVISLWDVETGHEVGRYVGHQTSVWRLVFSSDGTTLWSGGRRSNDGIRQWDLQQPIGRRLAAQGGSVQDLVWSPEGRRIATIHTAGSMVLWDLGRNRGQMVFKHNDGIRYKLAFDSAGDRLLSVGRDGGVHVHSLTSGSARLLGSHRGRVHDIAVSSDDRLVVTAGADGMVAVWSLTTDDMRPLRGHNGAVTGLALAPDGHSLMSNSADHTVRLWDLRSGDHRVLDRDSHGAIRCLAMYPDGGLAAWSGSDHSVRLWNRSDGQIHHLTGHGRPITALLFSPDGSQLVSLATSDRVAMVWNTGDRSGRALDLPGALAASFRPDGQTLATTSEDGTTRLWHLASGAGHIIHRYSLAADTVAFSPDGRQLSIGDRRRVVHIWNVDLPSRPDQLREWLIQVTTATITPGTYLASSP
ncbi:MAG: WD40 repeat domain-containing protein, partial [Myxococcota bacterium]